MPYLGLEQEISLNVRWFWWLLAYVSLGLGIIGIVVPGLPTVPFILLSAFAAARGSEKLRTWLASHQTFGPMIRDWESNGSVSRRAKWAATITMVLSGALMWLVSPKWWMAAVGCGVMLVVGTWLWMRPA